MGKVRRQGEIAEGGYAVAVGRLRGGLAYATVVGCAGFGALTSSSIATASLIGKVAVPEMRARGYSPALSTGVVAAGGTLGALGEGTGGGSPARGR